MGCSESKPEGSPCKPPLNTESVQQQELTMLDPEARASRREDRLRRREQRRALFSGSDVTKTKNKPTEKILSEEDPSEEVIEVINPLCAHPTQQEHAVIVAEDDAVSLHSQMTPDSTAPRKPSTLNDDELNEVDEEEHTPVGLQFAPQRGGTRRVSCASPCEISMTKTFSTGSPAPHRMDLESSLEREGETRDSLPEDY